MGVRIVTNHEQAVMYCSTTDWAFGPVVSEKNGHDAEERLELFCEFLHPTDPRHFTDDELVSKYNEWLAQEEVQWKLKDIPWETEA
jgi:hypothetical protein